jgi:signal transduction histidine kinase
VRWSDNEKPKESQLTLLDQLVTPYMRTLRRSPRTPVELLELRIDQVQRATGRLRDMRAFINNSVGQMASGVIVTDNVGRILLANPQAAFYLQGYANRVLTGELLTDSLTRLEFSDAGSWQQNLKTVLLDHRSVQLVARTADGRDLQIDIAPFSDIQYISGIVVNFTDISELKESERRRAEMLGFLSHDLRSPLASVMALAQLAEYKPEKLTSGELTGQIRQRIQSLLELIDDFLQLIRAESGDKIMLIELDLLGPAENALLQVEPQAATRQTILQSDFRVSQAWLLGNDNLLERTFVNLLTNAVKYSPDAAFIELGIDQAADEIHCWVKDNGYGIEAAALPTLFERFKRIRREEHQHEPGTGLGLTFVKNAVERHYGRIEVDSVVGEGTCFHLYFPALGEDS